MLYLSIPLIETFIHIAELKDNPVASSAATERLCDVFGSVEQARLYTEGLQVDFSPENLDIIHIETC